MLWSVCYNRVLLWSHKWYQSQVPLQSPKCQNYRHAHHACLSFDESKNSTGTQHRDWQKRPSVVMEEGWALLRRMLRGDEEFITCREEAKTQRQEHWARVGRAGAQGAGYKDGSWQWRLRQGLDLRVWEVRWDRGRRERPQLLLANSSPQSVTQGSHPEERKNIPVIYLRDVGLR